MKRKEYKLLIEGWRNYINKVEGGFGIVSERGFYGGSGGYVSMRTDIPSDNIIIYDDYSLYFSIDVGHDTNFCALTKGNGGRQNIKKLIIDIVELVTDADYEEIENFVDERMELYSKVFGDDIYENDKTIIFVPLLNANYISSTKAQKPNVGVDISGSDVDFDIDNDKLSGVTDFYDEWEENSFGFRKKDKLTDADVRKYLKMKDNIRWSLHDFGHTLYDSLFNGIYSGTRAYVDFEEIENAEFAHNLMGSSNYVEFDKSKFSGKRIFDKTIAGDKLLNKYNFVQDFIKDFTPGVGVGDTEFSFLSLMFKDPTDNGIDNIVNDMVKHIRDNFDRISDNDKKRFKLDKEFSSGFGTFCDILRKTLILQRDLINNVYDKFKFIFVP